MGTQAPLAAVITGRRPGEGLPSRSAVVSCGPCGKTACTTPGPGGGSLLCALPELLSASSLFQDEVKITIYHLRREVKWKIEGDFVPFLQKKEPKKRKTTPARGWGLSQTGNTDFMTKIVFFERYLPFFWNFPQRHWCIPVRCGTLF